MPDDGRTGAPPLRPQEERFRQLAENVREVFWVFDPSTFRLLYVNPAFERVTGLPVQDVYADPKSWRTAIDRRDRAWVEEEMSARTAAGKPHNLEFRVARPDGEVRWVWARGLPVLEEDGGLVVVGVAEDVTERKRAEEELERSLSLLRATLQATADGILAVDGRGRITTFNSRFCETWVVPEFVVTEARDEGRLWNHLLERLQDSEAFRERLRELGEQPQEDSFDVLEFVDGRVLEAYSRPRAIGDERDGRVWSFRDTTARARAERQLRERTRRLALHSRVLSHLARLRVRGETDRRTAFRRIIDTAARMLEVERVGVWLYDVDRDAIRLVALFQRGRAAEPNEVLRLEDAPNYFEALSKARTLPIPDVRTHPSTVQLATSYCEPRGIIAMLDAPVLASGEFTGVVCFEHVGSRPRPWTVEEQSFAGSIADLVSIVLEGADRQRAERDIRFLAEASAILSASLDYRTTLESLVGLVVPALADWCVVDLVEDDSIRRVASRHASPDKEELLRELERRYPPSWTSPQPAVEVMRTGRPELVGEVTDETWVSRAVDGEHRRLVEELGTRSYVAVPMLARGRTLGAITLASHTRRHDPSDLSVAVDLAGRAAMAIDNALLYERSEESNRAKSNFLAVMSHELRTPLTAIVGYADLMLEGISGPLSDTQREQLERITLRSRDLVKIIDEVLAYAQTESGGGHPRPTSVDVVSLLGEIAAQARPMVEESGLEFRVRLPEEPFLGETDPRAVRHILMNLLSNAARFTERGAVTLAARFQDGRALIRVEDTGPGIAAHLTERVFEPFFQSEEVMTREVGGTGLGLAIARRFARLLGGDVVLETRPGEGSTFTLELPVRGGVAMGTARRAASRSAS